MKTYFKSPNFNRTIFITLFVIFNCFLSTVTMALQTQLGINNTVRNFDHVINTRGELRLSVFTGLPVVGSSELAYGISDRLTVGVLGGFTPFEEAVGVRIRTVIYQQTESYRVYFCTPVIFYPQTRRVNPDPWFLTRPNINFEWLAKSDLRYKIGASIIASASRHNLFENSSRSKHPPSLWTAVHGGISLPFSSNMTFQAELSYVTKGIRTIDKFLGGPPAILILGASYTF